MLQIHFSSDDLCRVRIASVPDPMWEAVNGVQLLQNQEGRLVFNNWRRRVRSAGRDIAAQSAIRMFASLAPHAEYYPDFLTPQAVPQIDAGIDAVLPTPRRRLGGELTRLAAGKRTPAWMDAVARGDVEALSRVGTTIRIFHDVAIKPYLTQLLPELTAEYARRTQIMISGGTEALLNSFGPLMTWTTPVLQMRYPVTQTLRLDGRGLLLVPSFFCWRYPITLADPDLTPTLVYPIAHQPGWPLHPADTRLAALIGTTRAAILEATVSGRTTTELARRTGVSPATATHHLNILRDANLIASYREANTVVHNSTPLGLALLNGITRNGI